MTQYNGIRAGELKDLFLKLKDEQLIKRDMVIPADMMRMQDGQIIMDDLPDGMFKEDAIEKMLSDFNIKTTADFQLTFNPMKNAETNFSQKLNIPISYYRYLKENHQDMLDYNISNLFARADKPFFVRAFAPTGDSTEGMIRAMLSDRYKVIDHLDVLTASLDAIKKSGVDVTIGRCNLTETNMYVEFYSESVEAECRDFIRDYKAPNGDSGGSMLAGFVLSNSEVGSGKYQITPRAVMTVCSNGLIRRADALSSTHLGSKMESGIMWSNQTKRKELELVTSQVKDAVTTFLSKEYLGDLVDKLSPYTEKMKNPVKAVQNISDSLHFSEKEQQSVLGYFIESGDFSPFGAVQAVTYHAKTVDDADRQYEIETDASDLLELIPSKFDIEPEELT